MWLDEWLINQSGWNSSIVFLSGNQMENKSFKARNSNFQHKLASRPVASINDLLTWYLRRFNRKLPLDMCYSWFASGKVWIKKTLVLLAWNFFRSVKSKILVPVPHLQPRDLFLNSLSVKWLSAEFIFKNGDIFSTILDIISTTTKALWENNAS